MAETEQPRSGARRVLLVVLAFGLVWAVGLVLITQWPEAEPETPAPLDDPVALFERGIAARESYDYEAALVDFDALLVLEPDNVSARYYRGLSHFELDQWQAAIRDFDAVLAAEPDNLEAMQVRAEALTGNGQPDLAIEEYGKILALDPSNLFVLHSRALLFTEAGMVAEAIGAWDATIEQYPEDEFALRERGDAYGRQGQYGLAIESYDAVLTLNPGDFLARYNVALAAFELGDYRRAVEDLDRYLEAQPDDQTARELRDRAIELRGPVDSGDAAGSGDASSNAAAVPVGQLELATEAGWAEQFDEFGVQGTFVLHQLGDDRLRVHQADRAEEAMLPASTFKILNSLIGLETEVIDSVDEVIVWDGVDRSIDAWNQDHSLRSGIAVSAVWAYQDLARRIGAERMAEWVTAVGYGNANIGGPIDGFWLRGDLRISAVEQVDFLARLLRDDLPFSVDHQAAVREILVQDEGDGWTLGYKTGTALATEPVLGWLVGYTEHDGASWVFAMNLDLGQNAELDEQIDAQVRQQLARAILVSEGALPE